MAAPLRGTRALQLTLALIKPDAVAHPLIVEVRTNPEPLLHALGVASASGAPGPLGKHCNSLLFLNAPIFAGKIAVWILGLTDCWQHSAPEVQD